MSVHEESQDQRHQQAVTEVISETDGESRKEARVIAQPKILTERKEHNHREGEKPRSFEQAGVGFGLGRGLFLGDLIGSGDRVLDPLNRIPNLGEKSSGLSVRSGGGRGLNGGHGRQPRGAREGLISLAIALVQDGFSEALGIDDADEIDQ